MKLKNLIREKNKISVENYNETGKFNKTDKL